VKVQRDVAGCRGTAVTTVWGVPLDDGAHGNAGKLNKRCEVGPARVKGRVIEMRVDHRDAAIEILKSGGSCPCSLEADARR
jgi:translation initiation factor 1